MRNSHQRAPLASMNHVFQLDQYLSSREPGWQIGRRRGWVHARRYFFVRSHHSRTNSETSWDTKRGQANARFNPLLWTKRKRPCLHTDAQPDRLSRAVHRARPRPRAATARLERNLVGAFDELSVLLFRYHWAAAFPRGHTATQKTAASSSRNLRLPKRR